MPCYSPGILKFGALAAALALAGCGTTQKQANPENGGDNSDPALTSALEDQILVDPSLNQQANRNTVRPPESPLQAPYPVRAGGDGGGVEAARQLGCPGDFDYNLAWAQRLPPEFPVISGAKVTDAAGKQSSQCQARVVTFQTRQAWPQVIDFYTGRAFDAGYSAEQQERGGDHVLGGANPGSGSAYFVVVTPVNGGSEVALFITKGA